jgi:hypothetical protein
LSKITWKSVQLFGSSTNPLLALADCIELLPDISRNERKDDGYHGWKAHVLEYEDFILARESDEPIDDMWFAVVVALKKHLVAVPFLL